jgi:small subunit ribosomal protein S6
MRAYELMYIISPDKDDEEIAALIDKISGTIESLDGKVDGINQGEPWGHRRLAYPIDRFDEGYYVLTHFSIEPVQLGELERVLKLTDPVIRHLITRRQPQPVKEG